MKKARGIGAGFTLIELLVVIAIIGLLSSVVLAALNSARLSSRDAAIKQGVREMAKIMELQRVATGQYTGMNNAAWDATAAECSNSFTNAAIIAEYQANARALCSNTVSYMGLSTGSSGLYVRAISASRYTIMAYLPGKLTYFCVGSSGANSDTTPTNPVDNWNRPGCNAYEVSVPQ